MDLPSTICERAQALPVQLQRETLDFMHYLGQRYNLSPVRTGELSTEAFIKQFAGCIGADFPNDVNEADLPNDSKRVSFE